MSMNDNIRISPWYSRAILARSAMAISSSGSSSSSSSSYVSTCPRSP